MKREQTYERAAFMRRPAQARKTGSRRKKDYENPRLDPGLKRLFQKIGVPGPAPFIPDPFQLEAIKRIEDSDVLVSAPTGAGKTWIAEQVISKYLAKGLKSWYASPLKALSNSIYAEFRRTFAPENCGILTGDRKENPDAPIIVGTTEILRNQLYDAMHEGADIGADLVVLDEAHYLSDPERGVVWEEVLIYLPSRVRLLLLSATISNAEEIASWLQENRGTRAQVVRSNERPVPLEMLFLFPDGFIAPLGAKRGLNPRVKKFVQSHQMTRKRRGRKEADYGGIIKCLREFDLLPAIFFLKSRVDCDRALLTCPPNPTPGRFKEELKKEVELFLEKYPHLKRHRQLAPLLESLVGSHHAGQLPYWKILIEEMMNRGYLEAIFSTSTVAAGVNFPARTIVLVQSDRYDGHEFKNLTATELHQMTGRAGRRGKDNIGFALVVPGLHQDPQLIQELKDSPPEPITSQIHINFSMTLNLLLSHKPLEVKDLLDRSFAAYQEKASDSSVHRKWEEILLGLKKVLPKGRCDIGDPNEVIENIQKMKELGKRAKELSREIALEKRLATYREHIRAGRLFLHKNGDIYVVFHVFWDRGRLICAAHNIRKRVRARKQRIRLRKVPFEKIKLLYDYRLDLPEDYSQERIQAMFDAVNLDELKVLELESQGEELTSEELKNVKRKLKELPCEACEHRRACLRMKNRALRRILEEYRSLAYLLEGMGPGLWVSFKKHLRFLQETGFVDENERLTPDGVWASKLRLDHPLLIAEAIRKGGFDGLSPEVMAGCMASFVWDRIQDLEFRGESPANLTECEVAFERILSQMEEIRRLKVKRGFENPPIPFWPVALVYLWAKGLEWDTLLSFIPVDEGDMTSLITRTADHLRQVTNLEDTHPRLASTAKEAISMILREPVFIE